VKDTNRIAIFSYVLIAGLLVALVFPFVTRSSRASQPSLAPAAAPYPAGPIVSGLTWDSAVTRIGDGTTGDNWPITWGDDDLLYAAYGDGDGFSNRSPKLSLGFTTLSNNPPNISGQDFGSNIDTPEGQGSNGIKASGMLMVDGKLYMFVRNYKPAGSNDYTNARLAWSNDHGRTWTWANWHFADTFGAPDFVQFGKNYSGARDNYVYVVSQANDSAYGWSPNVVMARVPKDRVADRAAYEFFAGLGANNTPAWSSDITQRKPVFTDPNGVQRIGMTYNPALQRYFLTSAHQTGGGATHTPALGVFDAPEPWGPWSTAYYSDNFSGGYAFHHKFPTKWMSADGRTMWLLYSGSNTGASCNCVTLRKATLGINSAPPAPTAPPAATATPSNGPPPGGTGLQGDYFGDTGLTTLKLSRADATVNFSWGTGAVATGVGPDNFSARWTGQVTPRFSENYTFFTQSDDGVRLWINGQLVIDDWNRHSLAERAGAITLQAGQRYNLQLEYFEYNVDATVKLLWSSPSQPKEIVPQSQLTPPGTSTPPATPTNLPTPAASPSSTTPSATPTLAPTPPPSAGYQLHVGDNWIEAEQPTNSTLGAWAVQGGDASASNGQSMVYSSSAGGVLEYTFQLDYAGPIYIWLRAIKAPNSTRPVTIQLDGGPQDPATLDGADWIWQLDDDAAYSIQPGTHTFRIIGNVPQVRIDQLLITTRQQTVPPNPGAGGAPTASVPPAPTTALTQTQAPAAAPKLLFGMGAEADSALQARLIQEAPVRMLTSWYNGPNDLTWMTAWQNNLVPTAYGSGYAMHLVVFSDVPEAQVQTQYGTACGRTYPLSDRFLDDMRQLAQTFAGAANGPPLYVTLFTEFQTYACSDNAWNPDAQTNAYYRALKDRYLEALSVFHQHAPNARVSLGWGGWQNRWDDPSTGAGRSMFQYFADVMQASDFQSFQAMQGDSNVADVRAMVQTLGAYGPVMLAHYKPDNSSQATFDADTQTMLTDSYLSEMTAAGLFAWSFMDQVNVGVEQSYQFVKGAVQRYGTNPL